MLEDTGSHTTDGKVGYM